MPPRPEVVPFFKAFGVTWSSKVSGGLSVPFTIAAFFVPSTWLRVLFAVLAVLCFAIASYEIWIHEKTRADEAEAKLRPQLDLVYDRENSLINHDSETYRLRLTNTGSSTLDEVEVRVEEAPTLPYLRGLLPTILREQHRRTGTAMVLKGGTPRYIDFVQCSERMSAMRITDGTQMVFLCQDLDNGGLGGGFQHEGENDFVVEASGRDVPPCRQKFRVRSLLPNRIAEGDSLEIIEIS